MSKNRRAAAEPEKDKEKEDSTSRIEETALDVLSRAATMVEKSENSSPERSGKMSPEPPLTKKSSCERSPSFKERHPKFRKSSTPDYLVALEVARNLKRTNANLTHSSQSDSQSDLNPMDVTTSPNNNSIITEDLPLDMSIKKRTLEATSPGSGLSPNQPPPPPYRFNHSTSPHFITPPSRPVMYKSPPPYPSSTPSPPTGLPPPPSYEDSTVKCTYPTKNTPPPVLLQDLEEKSTTKIKEITIITNSSADPLLDEHFRRSLGADYESLFNNKSSSIKKSNKNSDSESSSVESTPPKVPESVVVNSSQSSNETSSNLSHHADSNSTSSDSKDSKESTALEDSTKVDDPVKAFQEDMEMEGYTVEDHFAKALGDTWIKLQKAEEEKRSKNSNTKQKSESENNKKQAAAAAALVATSS